MGTRALFLVRHGEYTPDAGGSLTDTGREQARVTSEYLAPNPIDAIWSSTLTRARETAEIIAARLGAARVRPMAILREGLYSKIEGYFAPADERRADRDRADAAFTRFFRVSKTDRADLLVCHGNLIRYLICRALDVSPNRWTRMTTNNCAVTRVIIRDTGAVRVVSYNETSHLPRRLVT